MQTESSVWHPNYLSPQLCLHYMKLLMLQLTECISALKVGSSVQIYAEDSKYHLCFVRKNLTFYQEGNAREYK